MSGGVDLFCAYVSLFNLWCHLQLIMPSVQSPLKDVENKLKNADLNDENQVRFLESISGVQSQLCENKFRTNLVNYCR